MINRMVSKDGGNINLGSRVKIGYYDQEHQVLSMDKTIFEEISDAFPDMGNTRIRNVLAAFLFTGDDVFKKISELSGGERGRVSLAKLMLSPANFLILDEPTNHLDIQSKEILEHALRTYTGTLLYVSHDRYFINQTATRILELRNKVLTNYIGNYDYYDAHRDELYQLQNGSNPDAVCSEAITRNGFTAVTSGNAAATETGTGVGSDTTQDASAPLAGSKDDYIKNKAQQARLRKIANDIKKIEASIEETEDKISELDEQINLPENATNVAKLTELSTERARLDAALAELYDKWEQLSVAQSEDV
jgi:ATP-binding cassette subfamily F protein 3